MPYEKCPPVIHRNKARTSDLNSNSSRWFLPIQQQAHFSRAFLSHFVHSSKFQLSWWIYQSRRAHSSTLNNFLRLLSMGKSKMFPLNILGRISLQCINPQQSYRWWRLLLYKFLDNCDKLKLYLLEHKCNENFSCFVRTFSSSFYWIHIVIVRCQDQRGAENTFRVNTWRKTFLLSALLFNIRLRVLSFSKWHVCSPRKHIRPPRAFNTLLPRSHPRQTRNSLYKFPRTHHGWKTKSINLLFLTPNFLTLVRECANKHKYVLLSI